MRKSLWHIWLTVIILVWSLIFIARYHSSFSAGDWGSFLSGVSSSLAFIWLIKGMYIQSENLRLQRIALENQAKELSNSAKFSSFSQIENIVSRACQVIVESELNITKPTEINTLFIKGMIHWKDIMESSSPDIVNREYQEWIKVEGLARRYLAYITQALKTYLDFNTDVKYDPTIKDEEFYFIYSVWGNKIPYLSEHSSAASIIAQELYMLTPGLESIKVAGMYALSKIAGYNYFKDGALEELKAGLVSKGYPIPTIAKESSEAD